MKTQTIDLRTDKAVAACIRINRPVSALAYDYAANDHVPIHEHTKSQLIYAIEGTMTLATREGKWVLLPTRALWVPAKTKHSIRMKSPVRMRTIFFDHTVVPPSATCAAISVSSLLRELITSMLKEPPRYSANSRGAQIAALICSELHLWHTLPLSLPWPREPRLRKVCDSMQRRPALSGDMEYWASRISMSSRTLARLFRAETGMSFGEWKSQLLLLEAQIRLAQGQSSSRIANALGYASHAAFSAMFRKSTGISPSTHRANKFRG